MLNLNCYDISIFLKQRIRWDTIYKNFMIHIVVHYLYPRKLSLSGLYTCAAKLYVSTLCKFNWNAREFNCQVSFCLLLSLTLYGYMFLLDQSNLAAVFRTVYTPRHTCSDWAGRPSSPRWWSGPGRCPAAAASLWIIQYESEFFANKYEYEANWPSIV